MSFRKVIDEEEKQGDDWCSEDRDNKGTGESEGGVKREDERSVEEKIRVMESDMRELKEKIRKKKEKRGLLSVDDRSIGGYTEATNRKRYGDSLSSRGGSGWSLERRNEGL